MKKNNKLSDTFDTNFFIFFLSFIVIIIFIMFFPYWFTNFSWGNFEFGNSGQIGDTIGGIMGPFIAIAAAILTFFAFWVQFKANEQQKIDLQIERFENKFYNMIEIHRQNVSEIKINESFQSRNAFIPMYNELKALYLIIDKFLKTTSQKALIKKITKKNKLNEDIVYNFSYLIFFFGIGYQSTQLILSLVGEQYEPLILNLEEHLEDLKMFWNTQSIDDNDFRIDTETANGEIFEIILPYSPFMGHMPKLSHYIRHLFQILKFINDQPDALLSYEAKYNYASTVRAQLSAHEQLLLFYNALSVLGKPWFDSDKNFIEKYCMVKSMPLPLADFFKKPTEILPIINSYNKQMFEWIEIEDRMNSFKN